MANFTLSIPEELKKQLDLHPEINWTEYLKQRLQIKIKEFKKFEELKNRGKL